MIPATRDETTVTTAPNGFADTTALSAANAVFAPVTMVVNVVIIVVNDDNIVDMVVIIFHVANPVAAATIAALKASAPADPFVNQVINPDATSNIPESTVERVESAVCKKVVASLAAWPEET